MFVFLKVFYNFRKIMGIGLIDGESIECLWFYFGGFLKIIKEMIFENRVDLFNDGFLNYGRKVKENLGKFCFILIYIFIYI